MHLPGGFSSLAIGMSKHHSSPIVGNEDVWLAKRVSKPMDRLESHIDKRRTVLRNSHP
jgi:hypothetical protein